MSRRPTPARKRAYCRNGHEMVSTRPDRDNEWVRDYCAEVGCGYGSCKAPVAEIKVS